MTERDITCIICPRGCALKVLLDGKNPVSVSGNGCKRGEGYAVTECISPMRVVTSTVRCKNGLRLPVKTDTAIPKEHIMDCMKIIKKLDLDPPVLIGDVLAENVYGSVIVATGSVE